MKVIGLIGVKGGGKDFISDELVETYAKQGIKTVVFSFSEAVRKYTFKYLRIEIRTPKEYEQFKVNTYYNGKGIYKSGREWLEHFGEGLKAGNPIVWSDFVDQEFTEWHSTNPTQSTLCNVIFKDIRHPSELQIVKTIARHTSSPLEFIFCDFHSDRYDDSNDINNELALSIRDMNCYKHRDRITHLEKL